MGKVKTVVMGDEVAEEKARLKAEAKRAQKKQEKLTSKSREPEIKEDLSKSAEILKMMEQEDKTNKDIKINKSIKDATQKKENKLEEPIPSDKEQETKKEKTSSKKEQKKEIIKVKHGKKYLEAISKIEKNKLYPISAAIKLVKATSFSSFDGSVEAHFNVAEKGLRGTVALPHGTGKQVRVAIADDAILEEVAAGKVNFDVLVAHPSMMPKLAKVAKILGPKGLMPNPKTGTIGDKPEEIAKRLSSGQFNWKTEPNFPLIHTVVGKVSFDDNKIEENYLALAKSIGKDKLKSAFIKATMGPAIKIQI